MIIKYCPDCFGNPYTTDFSIENCPLCGNKLEVASISDSDAEERVQLPATAGSSPEENYDDYEKPFEEDPDTSADNYVKPTNDTPLVLNVPKNNSSFGGVTVIGKVSQYRTSNAKSGYRRLLPRKLYQALVYNQRLEDFLHSFTVTEDRENGRRYVVNVHGTTNYGATIIDNEKVEVKGKLTRDNILMATEVNVLNEGRSTPVKFQRSVKAIAILCLIGLLAFLGIVGLFNTASGSSPSGILNAVWNFVLTMIAVYIVLLILYVLSLFTRIGIVTRLLTGGNRRRSSPLLNMLVIAFILTILLYNVFGIGDFFALILSNVLSVVGPIAVMLIGIILLFKVFK